MTVLRASHTIILLHFTAARNNDACKIRVCWAGYLVTAVVRSCIAFLAHLFVMQGSQHTAADRCRGRKGG